MTRRCRGRCVYCAEERAAGEKRVARFTRSNPDEHQQQQRRQQNRIDHERHNKKRRLLWDCAPKISLAQREKVLGKTGIIDSPAGDALRNSAE